MTKPDHFDEIIPGSTYPTHVFIQERIDGKDIEITFNLRSYVVGMYSTMSVKEAGSNSTYTDQIGGYDTKGVVKKLKKGILMALERGAKVQIGPIEKVHGSKHASNEKR